MATSLPLGTKLVRAITVRADVSDPANVKSLIDSAEQAFNSPVHILVNSFGVIVGEFGGGLTNPK
ncbi:short-chain type dehydrogenase/reductase-like protein [Trifolium pratense]|uniref:Short-chain type dehydrogenase/reductase-like protein n=1 Tax=Trifolium pratense TaxID=57577 RepID=A0A2K3LLE7_TRIPR|nr:short-chain type dehydrogenase/reductase-like protein [Trifolium pratense]